MLPQNGLTPLVFFAEDDCAESGPAGGEGESPDAGKKVNMGWSVIHCSPSYL